MATADRGSTSNPSGAPTRRNSPSEVRPEVPRAPRRTVTDGDLERSRPKPLKAAPPSFSGKAGDFVGWKERFLTFARRHYFEDGFEDAGDIDIGNYNRRNDHLLLEDHDPDAIASARLAFFAIEDACASGTARQVITRLVRVIV